LQTGGKKGRIKKVIKAKKTTRKMVGGGGKKKRTHGAKKGEMLQTTRTEMEGGQRYPEIKLDKK